MDRRVFIAGLGAALVSGSALGLAAEECKSIAPGVLGCTAEVTPPFQIVTQDCPQRCWAASIAGIFGYHGHPISQDVIAKTIYGTLGCLPSISSKVLNAVLNHEWTDDNGGKFTASITGLYDPLNGITEMDNNDLISQMNDDSPILYCNTHHAMVIVRIDYRKDKFGNLIAIERVHMADPFPGQGFHFLSHAEMVPVQQGGQLSYVASVACA